MAPDFISSLSPSPALAAGQIQVWRIELACADEAARPRARGLLSDEERARADRFHFDRDRRRYELRHGALRRLLGAYLEAEPTALDFVAGEQGKPSLAAPPSDSCFNLSHSGEVALVAVARARDLGVDVEHEARDVSFLGIGGRYFSERECAELGALPPGEVRAGFYRAWTRKEAFIKAVGLGLQLSLGSFDVTLGPGRPAQLLAVRDERFAVADWALCDLTRHLPEDYAGALVCAGPMPEVQVGAWPP